jgi:hypothetical protein
VRTSTTGDEADAVEVVPGEDDTVAERLKKPWKLKTPAQIRKEGNFLKESGSLYLRQHAQNPMEWYGWCEEAIARALAEDKPIFLSIGYSSCHWCHVMEHEVFEEDEVAEYMNEHFVNIKVDREERPDIDAIYMDAVLKMKGRGGWPMSMVLTPSLKPFVGGTYFPKARFMTLMKQTVERFKTDRNGVEEKSHEIFSEIAKAVDGNPHRVFNERALRAIMRRALDALDKEHGGLQGQMKFPTPMRWRYLVDAYRKWGNKDLAAGLRLTLDKMSQGGLHDHVGGGFHRYTVDKTWTVPHFEKMLYDNGQLASLFFEAGAAFDQPRYTRIGVMTADFMIKEMLDPKGGFYSSYDADSGGAEGTFYVWTPAQLRKVAGDRDGTALAAVMGVTAEGNFEHHTSVVTLRADLTAVSKSLKRPVEELKTLFDTWRPTLYQVRTKRIWPGLDTKLVTGWNGLALSGIAKAYIATREARYLEAAVKTANRIWKLHRKGDGTLARASNDGVTSEKAILDDYAFFAVGLLDLFEACGNTVYLERAKAIVAKADTLFKRPGAGWFQTVEGDTSLLFRHFEPYDSVRPAGNSQMLEAHLRLAGLTGSSAHYNTVKDTLAYYTETLTRSGLGMGGWASVALRYQGPFYEVVIAGDAGQRKALDAAWRTLKPSWTVKVDVPSAGASPAMVAALPPVSGKKSQSGSAMAYVCIRGACKQPTSDPKVFRAQLTDGWKH